MLIVDGPESGDVQLTSTYYGSVQVFLSGSLVYVATPGYPWTVGNARVVCRELGYLTTGSKECIVIVTWVYKIVRMVCQCK